MTAGVFYVLGYVALLMVALVLVTLALNRATREERDTDRARRTGAGQTRR